MLFSKPVKAISIEKLRHADFLHRGAIDWSSKFKDNLKPVFQELYDSVKTGKETTRVRGPVIYCVYNMNSTNDVII